MEGGDFILFYFGSLYYKCHKVNLKRGGSYTDYLDWIKIKKTTINSVNNYDDNSFQYTVTFASNYEKIGK